MAEGRAVSPLAGWLMIVGGVALAIFMFTPWFDFGPFGGDKNAWVLRRTDVLIFAAGIAVALGGAWLKFGDVGPEGGVVALLAAVAAVVGIVLVLRQVFSPINDAPLRFGIFLALGALVIGLAGSLMAAMSLRSGTSGPGPPTSG
jgi:predicted membrane channel-forming protein YqfA (hemolysin III family)